jgi:hypothetical protein
VTEMYIASAAVLVAGVLVCLGIGPRRRCDVVVGSCAVALALVPLLGKILLLLGQFRPAQVAAAAVSSAGAAAIWLAADRGARGRAAASLRLFRAVPRVGFAPLAWVAAAAMLVAVGYEAYIGARLPPVAWDAMYYHLISAAEWVRTGHFVAPLPGLSSGNSVYIYLQADVFPKDAELTMAWLGLFTHNTSLVQLTQVAYMPLLAGGTYGICRHLDVRPRWAIVAAALVTLTPPVLQQMGTDYVDVASAAPRIAAWQFLLAAFPARAPLDEDPNGPKIRNLLLAGVCLGLAAGVKSTGALVCVAALLVIVGLCGRDTKLRIRAAGLARGAGYPPLPSVGRCVAAAAIPSVVLGSFWYFRTWFVWGSPFWPITIGPFPGLVSGTNFTNVGGLQIPPQLRSYSGVMLLLRSWITPGYSLGTVWVAVLLPAIAIATVLAVRRRRPMPVLAVIAPLFIITVISPGAWVTRFSIPLVAVGAVALVLVLEMIPRGRIAARTWRIGAFAVGGLTLGLALSLAWNTLNNLEPWQVTNTVRQTLQLAARPESVRRDAGPWLANNQMSALMRAPGAVAFFANSAPVFALPLAGLDFQREVVVLPPYTPRVALTAAPARGRRRRKILREDAAAATAAFRPVVRQMRGFGARYLFVALGSSAYNTLASQTPAQLRLLCPGDQGDVYVVTG